MSLGAEPEIITIGKGRRFANNLLASGDGTSKKNVNFDACLISYRKLEVDGTLLLTDNIVGVDTSGATAGLTINLPDPSGAVYKSAWTKTTITARSDGQTLSQAIINVVGTAGADSSGQMLVQTDQGDQIVGYTGITPISFTGCSGGVGTMFAGNGVGYHGAVQAVQLFTIQDEEGALSTKPITPQPFGGEKINGAPGGFTFSTDYGRLTLYTNGVDWFAQAN